MSKHTPGPWKLHGRDTRGLPHSLVGGETLIAKVFSKSYGDVEQETHNAYLIAAAPELLEALEGLMVCFDDGAGQNWSEKELDAARAAIARSKGEA